MNEPSLYIGELTITATTGFPVNRKPVDGLLMAAEVVGVIDGKLYAFAGEYPVPLVLLEGLRQRPYKTIPDAKVFKFYLHNVTCTGVGLTGVVRRLLEVKTDGEAVWGESLFESEIAIDGWAEWLCSDKPFAGSTEKVVGTSGLDAWRAHGWFRQYAALINADLAIKSHSADGGELKQFATLLPDITKVPHFKEYAASVALDGDKKKKVGSRGPQNSKQRAIIELAALAGVIRRCNDLQSWPAAFEAACKARPGWVPYDWRDPVRALEKGVERLRGTRWADPHKWYF